MKLREIKIGVFYFTPPKPEVVLIFPYILDIDDAAA